MISDSFKCIPSEQTLGAVIRDIDLRATLDESVVLALREKMLKHKVSKNKIKNLCRRLI